MIANYISIKPESLPYPAIGVDDSIVKGVEVRDTGKGFYYLDFLRTYGFLNTPEYKNFVIAMRKIPKDAYKKPFKDLFKVNFEEIDLEPIELADKPADFFDKRNEMLAKVLQLFIEKKKAKELTKTYKALIQKHSAKFPIINDKNFLFKLLAYEYFEFGFFSFLMRSFDIEEIYIGRGEDQSRFFTIYLDHRKYSRIMTNLTFTSKNEFTKFVRLLGAFLNRQPSETSPLVNTKIPFGRGGRVQISIKPTALRNEGYVNIRLFPSSPFNIIQILKWGSLPIDVIPYFVGLFETQGNLIVSGATGSGKTTLINALLGFTPVSLRIITVEETPELILEGFPMTVYLVSTEYSSLNDLISASLRKTPQVYILGEVRTPEEIQSFIRSASSGQANISIATFHSEDIKTLTFRFVQEAGAKVEQLKALDVFVFQNKILVNDKGKDKLVRKTTGVYELLKEIPETLYKTIIEFFKKKYLNDVEDVTEKEALEMLKAMLEIRKEMTIKISSKFGVIGIKMIKLLGDFLFFLIIMEFDRHKNQFVVYDGSIYFSSIMNKFKAKLKADEKTFRSKLDVIKKLMEHYLKNSYERKPFKEFVQIWNRDRIKYLYS